MKKDGNLRALFRKHLNHFHWVTIENTFVEAGVPDNNYCYKGCEGWIEFKIAKANAVSSLKQEQVAWLLRRTRAGGRAFIAVRHDDELLIFDAAAAAVLKASGLSGALALYVGEGGPAHWNWAEIEKVLRRSNN